MSHFEDSILRVLKGNSVVGAAFLVSDRLVLTCTHVVEAADIKVGGKISLRSSDGREIKAVVEAGFRHDPSADVSILSLNEPVGDLQPLILGASSGTKGHRFSTFGFPKQGQELSGGGEIIGSATINGIKILQLRSPEVTPGFSGAPIFDEITKRIVGMVVAITPPDAYQRLGATAFAIPSEIIRNVCPELEISETCPYKSLDIFKEEDAQFFFGRGRIIQKTIDSLKREPRFLAVLGPSGSGKSSVVRAGLLPALQKGKVPGSDKWDIITIRPASQPFEQLDSSGLSKTQDGLEKAIRVWLTNHDSKTRLLLLVDQFEEVLVSTPEDIRSKFIRELAHVLDASVAITVVITLRDDFYSHFLKDASMLSGWLERGLVNIPQTLEPDELRAMIVEPAQAIGLTFEQGLVDVILDDAAEVDWSKGLARSTILPLLEFALTQLWEKRQDGQLTHNAYQDIGGVTGGLTQWADKVFHDLSENEKLIARLVLSQLVHIGNEQQGIPDTRQAKSVREILLNNQDVTLAVINKLIEKRLLTTQRDEKAGGDTVELIHEALLVEWGLLQNWVRTDRPSLIIHQALSETAKEWSADITRKDLLYRGKRLQLARDWENRNTALLTKTEKQFLEASIREEARERARRRVFVGMAGVIASTLLIFGPGIWGYHHYLRQQAINSSKLVEIAGGNMVFGAEDSIRVAEEYEPMLTHINIDGIEVEATEVTYFQYEKCIKAGKCSQLKPSAVVDLNKFGNHPIMATAFQAKEYCDWVGRRLPTTFEWELAARGLNGNPWPWYDSSSSPDNPINLPGLDKGNIAYENQWTTPVGSYPSGATLNGIFDLYGNVWEWTSSAIDIENDKIIQWNGELDFLIIQRGGGWEDSLQRITQIRMSRADDDTSVGFRCIRPIVP